jgi:hypothetical protein
MIQKTITKNNTYIIIDWDDTLFPTSWSIKNNINFSDIEIRNRYLVYFSELDTILYKFLNKLLTYGTVIIVTNALLKWINITKEVLPNTKYILQKIKIISARQLYQPLKNTMGDWKKEVFKDEVSHELKSKNFINVISIGDAEYEYNALIALHDLDKKNILKTVRLMSAPSHESLLDQLEVLYKSIPNLCLTPKHLDLEFKFFSNNVFNS